MKKAQRPYVSSRQRGIRSCCRFAERRRSREATSEAGVRWSARYRGAWPRRQQYTIKSKSVQKNYSFTIHIYRVVTLSIICPCRLIYNISACVHNIRHQHALLLWVMQAICWCIGRIVQCCAKYLGAVHKLYHAKKAIFWPRPSSVI